MCYLEVSLTLMMHTEAHEQVSMFNPIGSNQPSVPSGITPTQILTAYESGKVTVFDAKTGNEVLSSESMHGDIATDVEVVDGPSEEKM